MKKTTNKKSTAPAPVTPTDKAIAQGTIETTIATIETDAKRAAGEVVPEVVKENAAPDIFIASANANVWNQRSAKTGGESIVLRPTPETNCFGFEYVPVSLTRPNGRTSAFSILECSDTGTEVGKAFGSGYGLVNNSDFIKVIEAICGVLTAQGIKYTIATCGTLQGRERSFIGIRLAEGQDFTIGGRVFQSFLNCLNSIPSDSSCTVTFANNTFCVCCANTFAHVLQGKDNAKFHVAAKHTKNVKLNLAEIPVMLEAYFTGNQALFATLKQFAAIPCGIADAEKMFVAFLARTVGKVGNGELPANLTDKEPLSAKSHTALEKLVELHVRGKGNNGETVLDLFQAATEYYTHFSAGETKNPDKQFLSSEAGDGAKSKGEFFTWLLMATQAKSRWDAIARVGDTLLVNYRKK